MDDLLEKIIRENKTLFETEAPEGHFDRFEEKLKKEFEEQKKRKFNYIWKIAAVVVFALLIGNQARMYLNTGTEDQTSISLSSVSTEYAEIEYYYTSSIERGLSNWDQLVDNGDISLENQKMMSEEIAEFDATYAKLQEELEANPGDERVIQAMLEVYRSKLSVITLIIEKLENINRENTEKDETKI